MYLYHYIYWKLILLYLPYYLERDDCLIEYTQLFISISSFLYTTVLLEVEKRLEIEWNFSSNRILVWQWAIPRTEAPVWLKQAVSTEPSLHSASLPDENFSSLQKQCFSYFSFFFKKKLYFLYLMLKLLSLHIKNIMKNK